MRAYVFTDASLSKHAGQFVWLEIDTENARNTTARKQLKISALPTFFVLDPVTERVAIRWVGGATLPQLHTLLESGGAAVAGGKSGLDAQLALADSLYGEEDNAGAARIYEAALGGAPADWPQRARVLDALLFSLSQSDQPEKVVVLATAESPRAGRTTSGYSIATSGLGSALELPKENPARTPAIAHFEPLLVSMVRDPSITLSADDRSGGYIELLDARGDAGDAEGKKKIAEEWATFLEGEAAKAKTPEQRAVFDPHRLSAYLELNQPERALPMLQASEKDFPDDYNPPQRLAIALHALKRYDEALAASDRAMKNAYGPRKLRLYSTRTDVYLGRGDSTSARSTVDEAIRFAEALPEGQRSEGTIAGLKKRRTALGGEGATPH